MKLPKILLGLIFGLVTFVQAESQPVAKLRFQVTPIHCKGSCWVVLRAVLDAPDQLCVTSVRFTLDRDGCNTKNNTEGCFRDYETDCHERIWSERFHYTQSGRYWVSFVVKSDNTSLPAKGMYVDVDELNSN